MDYEQRVRRASGGDVKAFVDLTWQFQHMAFGAALALVNDFHQAEDVVQEAFVAAWSALPSLADPAAFPGWLRSIVRHQAFRMLRKRTLRTVPLAEAEDLPAEELPADRRLEQRRQSAMALAAIAGLPGKLREPATLFFIHECSHQDIAVFLGLPVATVNNRLHAARSKLKERMLAMVTETFHSHALPDDFANRIGRLIDARGSVVEALFDPNAPPGILTELAVSDEANRRAVAVQVIQPPSGGIVRGIALSPADALPRGSTVLSSGNQSETPVNLDELARILPQLAGPSPIASGAARLLETGIKVIDVMCPLVAGGNAILAGELATGPAVTLYELTYKLKDSPGGLKLFTLLPLWREAPPGWSFSASLKEEGFADIPCGAVQHFFLRAEDGPWAESRLSLLDPFDVVIRFSRKLAGARVYPAVDVLTSRSRLFQTNVLGDEHVEIAERTRQAIAALSAAEHRAGREAGPTSNDALMLERALKLQNYFTQPYFVAEPWHGRSGTTVSLAESLQTCRDILDGRYDDLPADAFYFSGGIVEIRANAGRPLTSGPVTPSEAVSESSMLRVVLLNDGFTPMAFVMPVLEHIFDIDHETALRLMRQAHHEGRAECGIYPAAVADAKAKELQDLAREHGHRLSCVLEPVQSNGPVTWPPTRAL
jgi:RNA polymerase sigma factor (sigma-70 family)